jgi:hypothetical protein
MNPDFVRAIERDALGDGHQASVPQRKAGAVPYGAPGKCRGELLERRGEIIGVLYRFLDIVGPENLLAHGEARDIRFAPGLVLGGQ